MPTPSAVPLSPDEMGRALETKLFTSRADVPRVATLYRTFFESVRP